MVFWGWHLFSKRPHFENASSIWNTSCFHHGASRGVKHLLDRPPPRRLAGLAVLGPRHQRLLHPVRHPPPLAHLGVLPHALHVPGVVVPDVLEAGEQDAGSGVVEDAVCWSVSWGACITLSGPDSQSWMLQSLICFNTSGHTAACTSLYLATCSGLSLMICAKRRPG